MYTVVICVLIGIAVAIGIAAKGHYKLSEYIGPVVIFGLLGCMAGLAVSSIISRTMPASVKLIVNETPLVSLKGDESLAHGGFFLGCGSINEEVYYFYYYQDKEGNIHFGKMPADDPNVMIREEDGASPVLRVSKQITTYPTNNWSLGTVYDGDPTYIFIIPKGAIKRNFSLNGE